MSIAGGFLRAAAFAALALPIALPAAAVDRGKQLTITRKEHAAGLLDAVENAAWAADGQAAQKPVYVVYSTECPWSKKLFEDTRALAGKVQLRWIPAAGGGAPDVVALRNGDAVAAAFAGRRARVDDAARAQRRVTYNVGVMDSINYQLRGYDNSKTFAFPTLVYRTAQGVRVVAGNPKNLAALPGEVLGQADKANLVPAALEITEQAPWLSPSRNLPKWYHERTTPMVFRAAPSPKAAPVDELDKNLLAPVTGVVADTGWIEVAFSTAAGSRRQYVHDPLMARMALLDFRVKPQGGIWQAGQATKALAFPDPESPVLETLQAGERYQRKGVVESNGRAYDQIVLYANGEVGYAPR
ncbi:MAG: hypothetical protein QM761_12815 [Pseudoxanthomonas sp.]